MGTLLDALAKTKRRENAGSDTAARFDYQKNWALCEMLTRHKADTEYLGAFEFHDDVLFLTPELEPDAVDFYQVKTSTSVSPRSIASITAPGKKGSTIAKMVSNCALVQPPFTIRLVLVSNNAFEFSKTSISGAYIPEPHRTKFLERLAKEFPQTSEDVLAKLHFMITDLPVDEMETFVKGKALEIFEKRFGDGFTQNVLSWLRLIQGEIRRRNNYSSEKITSVAELIEHKCISRTFIATTLDNIEKNHRQAPDMTLVKATLQAEGWVTGAIVKLDRAIPNAAADYNDPANTECKALAEAVRGHIKTLDLEDAKLSAVLDGVFDALSGANVIPEPYRDKSFVAALGVLIYNEEL